MTGVQTCALPIYTVYVFLDFDYCDEQRMASYAMLAGKPITFTAKNGQKEFSIPLPSNPPEGTLIDVYHDIFKKFIHFFEKRNNVKRGGK